jgi:hypothetical protein
MATIKYYKDSFSKLEFDEFDESRFYVTISSIHIEKDCKRILLKADDLDEMIMQLIKLRKSIKNNQNG